VVRSRAIGEQSKVEDRRQHNSGSGATTFYELVRELMPMQGNLTIERICQLA